MNLKTRLRLVETGLILSLGLCFVLIGFIKLNPKQQPQQFGILNINKILKTQSEQVGRSRLPTNKRFEVMNAFVETLDEKVIALSKKRTLLNSTSVVKPGGLKDYTALIESQIAYYDDAK